MIWMFYPKMSASRRYVAKIATCIAVETFYKGNSSMIKMIQSLEINVKYRKKKERKRGNLCKTSKNQM